MALFLDIFFASSSRDIPRNMDMTKRSRQPPERPPRICWRYLVTRYDLSFHSLAFGDRRWVTRKKETMCRFKKKRMTCPANTFFPTSNSRCTEIQPGWDPCRPSRQPCNTKYWGQIDTSAKHEQNDYRRRWGSSRHCSTDSSSNNDKPQR